MVKKKSENARRHLRAIGIFTVLGVILGLGMIRFVDWQLPEGISAGERTLRQLAIIGFMLIAFHLHIVIHEAGHLIFGLASGYRFSSFRIGSFMLLKQDRKLVHKKHSVAGTGGQCLMIPPEMQDGKIPVIAYNLGGSIMNLIVSVVFLALFMLTDKGGYAALFHFMMIATGLLSAFSNGIPIRTGTIDNDGYNAISLGKNPEAMRAFWIQMKVVEQLSLGLRLKDMPDDWFQLPSDASMKNNLVAAIGVFRCNRLMDQHRFGEALELIDHMLAIESGMVGIHRNMMICDRIYLELIGENKSELLEQLYNKEQKRFMKASRTSPSVIRTEYTLALLAEKDQWKAHLALERFEKAAKRYPYPNDIQSERELMKIANEYAPKDMLPL